MDAASRMSDRDWTHPYYFLKKLAQPFLGSAGFTETSEELMPDVFGSAYSIFRCGNRKIRLIWDGKDGWGYAQDYARPEANQPGDWVDIECFLTEGDIDGLPQNDSKIEEFRSALSAALAN